MKSHVLATLVAVCVAVPCIGPAAAQPAPCLRQIDIYSFAAVPGNRSLVVEDRAHRFYRLNFQGICNGLQFKLGLRFKTFSTGNLSCLSRGDEVIQRDPIGPQRCIIRDIQVQTPELDRMDRDNAWARR